MGRIGPPVSRWLLLPVAIALVLGWGHSSADRADTADTATAELQVVWESSSGLVTCNNVACDVPVGHAFEFQYVLTALPSTGFSGFQSEIDYKALVANGGSYLPTVQAGDEIVWADSVFPLRSPAAPTGNEGLVNHADSVCGLNCGLKSNASGVLVNLTMNCSEVHTSSVINLVAYDADDNDDASVLVGRIPPGKLSPSSDAMEVTCSAVVGGNAELPSADLALGGNGASLAQRAALPLVAASAALAAVFTLGRMWRYRFGPLRRS